MPNIPNINPELKLKRGDVINLLLTSVALEGIGHSNLLNAEGEKLQKAIQQAETLGDLLEASRSVEKIIEIIIKKEILLQFKLEELLGIPMYPKQSEDEEKIDPTW
ncbi:hypothetical protein [Heyndrickxia acidicola]|uniref:Uncharacterized protein n=1 Tax=Heyndrickxia acidicola TaxID=209389 RepID=A0ABU6MJN9_9BACI|nr:hypothetical protein [Heyndrickxia acidicola]MED1204573.1 hypothetical protein [Heyndrickxia acidicola]